MQELSPLALCPDIEEVDLSRSCISTSQQGLKILTDKQKLKKLNLEGIVCINDSFILYQTKGIPPEPEKYEERFFFKKMTQLEDLNLRQTSVSLQVILSMQEKLPSLKNIAY